MRITSIALALVLASASGAACAQTDTDQWQFALTPYLWLPTIDGSLRYSPPPGGGGGPSFKVGPTDWLDLLNIGALVSGSAKKGKWSINSDVVYLSLTSKDTRVASVDETISVPGTPIQLPVSVGLNLNTRSDLDGLLWTIAGGYSIKQTDTAVVDLIAGIRYFGIDTKASWDLTADITTLGGTTVLPAQGRIAKDVDLWDGIIGIRGQFSLSVQKWSVPYYFDIGAGDSDLTWQAMTGLNREFGWGDLMLMYRHLEYDQDPSGLFQSFSFSGPAVGVRFHF
jgi:hypothetical protein